MLPTLQMWKLRYREVEYHKSIVKARFEPMPLDYYIEFPSQSPHCQILVSFPKH